MPEPIDFEQIALKILNSANADFYYYEEPMPQEIAPIVDALRHVWNARGEADRKALGVEFRRAMDAGGGEIHPEEILKGLDRPEAEITQFEDATIERVLERASDYEIKKSDGWLLSCPKVEGLPAPVVGETIRTYGLGKGFPIKGIVVAGRVYR